MVRWQRFLRICSAATMIAALPAAKGRAQTPGGPVGIPELSAPAATSAATEPAPRPAPVPTRTGGTAIGAMIPGAAGTAVPSSAIGPVDSMSQRAAVAARRPQPQRSGDPVAVRKKRVAAARKALADLDRRITVETSRALTASHPAGRTSGHLVATSNPPARRPDIYASTTPAHPQPAAAGPRRETAVVRAGATMTRPSVPMPNTRSQPAHGAGVSRAVIPPPTTRSSYAGYRTPPNPSRTLPAAVPAGTYSRP